MENEKHICEKCGKAFDSVEAREMHIKAKHSEDAKESVINPERKNKIKNLGLPLILIVILLIATVYFVFLSKPSYEPGEFEDHVKGTGIVIITEFSDFQCPACGGAQSTVKDILSAYDDKVSLIYKHFPLTNIHPEAFKAAEASECAADQGMFWEMHDKMFTNQDDLYIFSLKGYASQLGLDIEKFNTCMDSDVMASRVNSHINEGRQKGVSGTPTFFINDRKVVGGSYSEIKSAIDAELT